RSPGWAWSPRDGAAQPGGPPPRLLGVGAFSRRGAGPVRGASPGGVDAAAVAVPGLLRGHLLAQPQPLPDLPRPARQRLLLGVDLDLLRVPDLRLDPDPQPQSPQVRGPGRRR